MFTDWGAAHSQSSLTEKKLVRDFVTFMKAPREQMSLVSLEENPHPTLDVLVKTRNNTEKTAAKVKFTVYNPDRKKIFHTQINEINLAPGAVMKIPLEFTLTGVMNNVTGISHVDYTLYDTEMNPLAEEKDGARFAVYREIDPYSPDNPYDVWPTSFSKPIFCHFHLPCN